MVMAALLTITDFLKAQDISKMPFRKCDSESFKPYPILDYPHID